MRSWLRALLLVLAVIGGASVLGASDASRLSNIYSYDGHQSGARTPSAIGMAAPAIDAYATASPAVANRIHPRLWTSGVATNTGSRLLSPSSLADEVANVTGGVIKVNKGGYTVSIPHGSRGISVRVMELGGSRTNYWRVSVPGKEAYTVTGRTSMDPNLTHIDIGESSLDDILSIIARIQGGG